MYGTSKWTAAECLCWMRFEWVSFQFLGCVIGLINNYHNDYLLSNWPAANCHCFWQMFLLLNKSHLGQMLLTFANKQTNKHTKQQFPLKTLEHAKCSGNDLFGVTLLRFAAQQHARACLVYLWGPSTRWSLASLNERRERVCLWMGFLCMASFADCCCEIAQILSINGNTHTHAISIQRSIILCVCVLVCIIFMHHRDYNRKHHQSHHYFHPNHRHNVIQTLLYAQVDYDVCLSSCLNLVLLLLLLLLMVWPSCLLNGQSYLIPNHWPSSPAKMFCLTAIGSPSCPHMRLQVQR